ISEDEITITNNVDEFKNADAVKINYSTATIAIDELRISPQLLLFEETIKPQTVECFDWNGIKAFFKSDGDIPFDIFAASFYLLGRYEEYLPVEEDQYGRFAHTNSLAFKENFLHLPLVDLWIKELIKTIGQKHSVFNIQHSTFAFIPTYDIDIAYSYLHHSF